MSYLALKYFHILGAAVLFGTGMGIAFFMFVSVRSRNVAGIAMVAKIVVLADYVFTLTAALVQPVTGLLLVDKLGLEITDFWVITSIGLYVFIGICWVPVVFMQKEMSALANEAVVSGDPLPARFHVLYRRWFVLGFPAFAAMLAIFYLMLFKPVI